MDVSNAAHLTDAEAEATLRALGPQLEWEETSGCWRGRVSDSRSTLAEYVFFQTHLPDDTRLETFSALFAGESYVEGLESVNAAKAACERHHATGKWK